MASEFITRVEHGDDPILIQQGWQCPVCKRVYSPTTSMCLYCGGDQETSISTAGSINTITAESYPKAHYCTVKGRLCINASLNGFCTLSACNIGLVKERRLKRRK